MQRQLAPRRRDPGEEHDLSGDPPADAPLARLRAELAAFAAADEGEPDVAARMRARRDALEREDPDALRRIEALGY